MSEMIELYRHFRSVVLDLQQDDGTEVWIANNVMSYLNGDYWNSGRPHEFRMTIDGVDIEVTIGPYRLYGRVPLSAVHRPTLFMELDKRFKTWAQFYPRPAPREGEWEYGWGPSEPQLYNDFNSLPRKTLHEVEQVALKLKCFYRRLPLRMDSEKG